MDIIETIRKVIMVLVPMILSLSVHEFAHAWTAYKLGDDTAARQGRLTLNPLAHIDMIGTLLLPIILTISGGGIFFGWAKPVPVSRQKFGRHVSMRTGDILVSIAGPLSNIALAVIAGGVLVFIKEHVSITSETGLAIFNLLKTLFFLNIALAVFNMLPIPPLDGHYLLPENIQHKMRRYQMIIFIALIFFINIASEILSAPIYLIAGWIINFWAMIFG